jgi:hypothetical protein
VDVEFARVRAPEWLLGAGSLVLLGSTFLKWYGLKAAIVPTYSTLGYGNGSRDAWSSLSIGRWLILIVGLVGVLAWYAQAYSRAPAIPISLTVVATPLALLLSLFLIDRVFIDYPGAASLIAIKPGAVIGMLGAFIALTGAWFSLRLDGIRPSDGPQEIETFRRTPAAVDPD